MKKDIFYVCLVLMALMFSCDNKTSIIAIKNKTTSIITGVTLDNNLLADSVLYNKKIYMDIFIDPEMTQNVALPNFTLSEKADSSKIYLFIFYSDSLKKYQKLKISKGILNKSLWKKVVLPLGNIREPLDTIYVK